jgi:nucleotide-binding universal stress UspA family protein
MNQDIDGVTSLHDTVMTKIPVKHQHLYQPEEHSVDETNSATSHPLSSPTATSPLRTILIPVDQSPHSSHTVKWAKKHFLRSGDLAVLIHVRPYQQVYLTDLGGDVLSAVESMETSARHASHELIRTFGRELMLHDEESLVGPMVKGFAIRGDARSDILRKAKELHADAIIMGSRGLGTLKRALLGSVSDYIAHNASCPVVIVREPHGH